MNDSCLKSYLEGHAHLLTGLPGRDFGYKSHAFDFIFSLDKLFNLLAEVPALTQIEAALYCLTCL